MPTRSTWVPMAIAAVGAACVSAPDQHNRLCPCSEGWVCSSGICVEEALVCPGSCGDGIHCPAEACDDGDVDPCTKECNATCTGPSPEDSPTCVAPSLFFEELSREVDEPAGPDAVSQTHRGSDLIIRHLDIR